MRSRSFTLVPASGKRVLLGGPDSTAWCDRLQGERRRDYRGPGAGALACCSGSGLMGESREPVRFAADAASASEGGGRVWLEGDARLWQGARLVRADRLDYERERELVTGRGDVLTTARRRQQRRELGRSSRCAGASYATTAPPVSPPTRAM